MEKRIQFRRTSYAKERAGQFWVRFFAFIVDLHLVGILTIPVYFILGELGYNAEYQLLNLKYLELENIIAIVTLLTYFTLMEQSKWRASFGKMFLRLTISNTNGERLTLAKSALRNLLKLLSIGTLIGVWIIDATKQHQSLHDILAGTLVNRK